MKYIAYTFGVLSILCLLAGMSIMFNMNILPWEDKWFLNLFFIGIFFFGVCAYIETHSQVTYTKEQARRRKIQKRSMIFLMVCSTGLILLTTFGL